MTNSINLEDLATSLLANVLKVDFVFKFRYILADLSCPLRLKFGDVLLNENFECRRETWRVKRDQKKQFSFDGS